ncbi:hypothetical protein H6P81_006589 [Aristolochia fimbriata]|uniref:Putative E3 ubiquitin-protein ligase LIN ARM-like domain-containing protein n=1 Tax=Aristolochia fimbriata TaxID=158543 RepID=A0AAV7EZW8_ARIFI|nr:hypothetical protein H6P81_006589 [Aristolochia fimbriata]
MGLPSKMSVSRDCLIDIAWLGCRIEASGSAKLTHSASETLLSCIEQFLDLGLELEERLLACMCMHKYTSARGTPNLMSLSEGLRESLRWLSSITWMAEDLLKLANSVLPEKIQHVSCVHTQILEVGNRSYGAINDMLYYKGLLCTGHPAGSVRKIDSWGQMIFIITQSRGVKVYDGSRDLKTICKNELFTSVAVTRVRFTLGAKMQAYR